MQFPRLQKQESPRPRASGFLSPDRGRPNRRRSPAVRPAWVYLRKTLAVQAMASGTVNSEATQKATTQAKLRVRVSGGGVGRQTSAAMEVLTRDRKLVAFMGTP